MAATAQIFAAVVRPRITFLRAQNRAPLPTLALQTNQRAERHRDEQAENLLKQCGSVLPGHRRSQREW